jgi:hypothetical protein
MDHLSLTAHGSIQSNIEGAHTGHDVTFTCKCMDISFPGI